MVENAGINKMQSETADFAPGAAIWRTGRNIVSSLILPIPFLFLFPALYENMTSSTKPEIHNYRNSVRGGPSYGDR